MYYACAHLSSSVDYGLVLSLRKLDASSANAAANLSCYSALDSTIVATVLSTIGSEFHRSNEVSWIGTSFLLTQCGMTILLSKICIFRLHFEQPSSRFMAEEVISLVAKLLLFSLPSSF